MAQRPLHVAVVGATGAVGRALVQALDESDLAIASVALLGSEHGAGSELEVRGASARVEALDEPASDHSPKVNGAHSGANGAAPAGMPAGPSHAGVSGAGSGSGGGRAGRQLAGKDLVFLAAGAAVSRAWAERARAAGSAVIDLSPAFRADPQVPLVLPEVNPDAIGGLARGRLVATPGAPATQLALVLAPLHRAAGIERVAVTTLEPASAGGQRGVDELEAELRAMLSFAEPPVPTALPHRLAFNLVPQAGGFDPAGESDDERGLVAEVRRLLGSSLRLAATHVRVPVFHGVLQVVSLRTRRPLPAAEARTLLRAAPGVKLLDGPGEGIYPMPMLAVNDDAALAGRLRDDPSQENGLQLLVAGDNLRRGAATTALGVARLLVERQLLGGA